MPKIDEFPHRESAPLDAHGTTLHLATTPNPARLVVFVHGFLGKAVGSWETFPDSGRHRAWWREADMLFFGFDSRRETPKGVADRLRRLVPQFYPVLPDRHLKVGRARVREESTEPYRELFLVGHSLGGVVVRRAVSDGVTEAQTGNGQNVGAYEWLDGHVRLFSPAIGGFRPAGWAGVGFAIGGIRAALDAMGAISSAYKDLKPGSKWLEDTESETVRLAQANEPPAPAALRASILWANPENVVEPHRYVTDFVDDSVDGTDHSSVCKPIAARFPCPWQFVEDARLPDAAEVASA